MGVKGLWSLLNPVARPVQIESLENKRLAIDSSIWLYQFQSTMRDKDGRVLVNAHVLGFLRRINKLLFHGIKPVFVFDGGAPALKRSTIAERKRKKAGAAFNATKMAEKLLQAQMRREALRLAQQAEGKRSARSAQAAYEDEGGETIPENAVYLDQLEGNAAAGPSRSMQSVPDDTPEDELAATRNRRKKYETKDRYYLPDTEMPSYSTEDKPDARLATKEELQQFIEEVHPEDIDIESPEFRALPTEVQYEIIGDMRLKSRQQSHQRLMDMLAAAPTSLDFSKAQIHRLNERNALTQQLLTVTDMVGKAHLTIPIRVASERNRQYLLVKRDDGGGWALGVREGTKDRPIVLEPETQADRIKKEREAHVVSDSDDDPDYISSGSDIEEYKPPPDDELRQHRRREVLEAIAKRYAPANTKRPLDVAITPFGKARAQGAVPLFDLGDEGTSAEPPVDVSVTANDEALALALQREELGDDEDEADPELARALALSRAEGAPMRSSPPPVTLPPDIPSSDIDEDDFEEVALVRSGATTPHDGEPIVIEDSDDDLELVEVVPAKPKKASEIRKKLATDSLGKGTTLTTRHATSSTQPRPRVLALANPPQPSPPPLQIIESGDEDEFEEVATAPVLLPVSSNPAPVEPEPAGFQISQPRVHAPRSRPNLTQLLQMARPQAPGTQLEPEPEPEPEPVLVVQHAPEPSPSPEREVFRRGAPSPSPDLIEDGPFAGMAVRRSSSPPPDTIDDGPFAGMERRAPSPSPPPFVPDTVSDVVEDEPTQLNDPLPALPSRPFDLDSEEEDDAIEWSRSPTPQPRDTAGTALKRTHSSAQSIMSEPEDDEEMAPADMVNEEDDYARFLAQIKNRDLNEVRGEIDDEIRILNQHAKAAQRDSDEITQSMVVQIQTLLRHFGIPYITAPMEAEAQCAKLAELGLVDGVITDDSDVFLFGATECFKNIFNDAKFAECFLASDIQRELSLTRERLISLSYLLGSDYTLGLNGVGPVLALELLANFPGPDGLTHFREWWLRVQSGTDTEEEADTRWKKSFKKRFADSMQLSSQWPDPLVREAYLQPAADESDEPFRWGFPRLASLRTFLHEELSWSISKVDDELTPIVQRIAKRGKGMLGAQTTLLPFFDNSVGAGASYVPRRRTTANLSKRLMSVIKAFREAEAEAEGKSADSVQWGEMLAGVDENDPKGTGTTGKPPPKVTAKVKAKGKGRATTVGGADEDGDGDEETGGSTQKGKRTTKPRAPRKGAAGTKRKARTDSAGATPASTVAGTDDGAYDAQDEQDIAEHGDGPGAAPKRRRVAAKRTASRSTRASTAVTSASASASAAASDASGL